MTADQPTRYMERTRDYYRALGYSNDYVWAHFDDVPFARLGKPLSKARIGLVTTAGPEGGFPRDKNGWRQVWSGDSARQPARMSTEMAWDRDSTHTDDVGCYLPIDVVKELVGEGVVGAITARFHCVSNEYSQRKTIEEDAPQVLQRLRDDGADAAILCPL